MDNRLVVATECPTCGAPLDFPEGTTALRCLYCRSALLVTSRKQVLSYAVMPKLDARRATALARDAQKAGGRSRRISQQQLYFIPYYRFTGQELRWEKESQQSANSPLAFVNQPEVAAVLVMAGVKKKRETAETVVLKDRHIEKNFVACSLHGVGLYSLGIRPAVLRLSLFRRQPLESLGKVVAVSLPAKKALSQGYKTDSTQLVHREIVGQRLSILYFPFWVVEYGQPGDTRLTIIDAVSHSVIASDAPSSLYATLDQPQQRDPRVVGFRPLVCPHCGWELPVRPDDILFFCSSCRKVWQVEGNDLHDVPYQVVVAPGEGRPDSLKFLPFWMIRTERNQTSAVPLFLPAFRYRRAKVLVDLAQRLSTRQPTGAAFREKIPDLHGCSYDQDDALALARLVATGRAAQRWEAVNTPQEQVVSHTRATFTWVPFQKRGNFLADPWTGLQLSHGLLM